MKILFSTLCVLVLVFTILFCNACKKDKLVDERDSVIGDYYGILIHTAWNDPVLEHDTSAIKMTLLKSSTDSLIDLKFDPSIGNIDYPFYYHNMKFVLKVGFSEGANLTMTGDSLYLYLKQVLGPVWMNFKVKKN